MSKFNNPAVPTSPVTSLPKEDPQTLKCFLGIHRWSKWSPSQSEVYTDVYKTKTHTIASQQRTCLDCGKTQVEKILVKHKG